MIDWLLANKEWLFSGIGLALLSAFYTLFRLFIRRKIENRQYEKLFLYIGSFINVEDREAIRQRKKEIPIKIKSTQELIQETKDQIEVSETIDINKDELAKTLQELEYWFEAEQWLEKHMIDLANRGYKIVLKECTHLTGKDKGLGDKKGKKEFRDSLFTHLFWIINCLKYQDDESFEENLRKIELTVEGGAYHTAFSAIKAYIPEISKSKKNTLSYNAQKIINEFLDHLLEIYKPVN